MHKLSHEYVYLCSIDGIVVSGMSARQVAAMLSGDEGTRVTIELEVCINAAHTCMRRRHRHRHLYMRLDTMHIIKSSKKY
jgi:hypothetical protein